MSSRPRPGWGGWTGNNTCLGKIVMRGGRILPCVMVNGLTRLVPKPWRWRRSRRARSDYFD